MKNLLVFVVLMVSASTTYASCSASQMRDLMKQGLSDQQIDQRCGMGEQTLPAWLEGLWQLDGRYSQGCGSFGAGCGPFFGKYKIYVEGNSLKLYEADSFLGDLAYDGTPVPVTKVSFNGSQLEFVTYNQNMDSNTRYVLNVVNQNKLKGSVNTWDDGMFGLPPTRLSGTVVLRKDKSWH